MIPVILSGGSGTRLWPLSRKAKPKQFLSITDQNTMLQNTITRLMGLEFVTDPLIVCNEEHRFIVAEQLREICSKHKGILLEPAARDTAPAITLAALFALDAGDETLLVLPSDHVIENVAEFRKAIAAANNVVEQGLMATFGIKPTNAETGYGYIKRGKALSSDSGCYYVEQFREKPNKKTAEKYVESGEYFWNGGMFAFRASKLISEMEKNAPEVLSACKSAIALKKVDSDFTRVDAEAFKQSPSISIDYAIMEKTEAAIMVPLDAGWSDVGSYESLWQVIEKDENSNASKGDVVFTDSQSCLAISESRLVCLSGVKDVVVVETPDAVLVTSKENSQQIKDTVAQLKSDSRVETEEHRQGFRPWGSYDCVDRGDRFQVKRITVKPGQKLSLQMHHHRAEHWVVVTGTALVKCGESTQLLTENESIYIPLGELHQLSNPGVLDLELIEVQSGSYLGENDILRFEDEYGRG